MWVCGAERRWRLKQSWLGGRADNLPIEMARLPLPVLHPLDSERPFFSAATKAVGSDCAGTFTGPLCFQMVLFSCDTVDTQHLPRIRTLLLGGAQRAGGWCAGVWGRGRPGSKRGKVWRDHRGGNAGGAGLCFFLCSGFSSIIFSPDNIFFFFLFLTKCDMFSSTSPRPVLHSDSRSSSRFPKPTGAR